MVREQQESTIKRAGEGEREVAIAQIPDSKENPLSIFPLEPGLAVGYSADSPQRSLEKRRPALVILVVLFLLGAATATAAYYHPSKVFDATARAQAIVMRFILPSHKQLISRAESAAHGETVAREPGMSGTLESALQRSDVKSGAGSSSAFSSANVTSSASGLVNQSGRANKETVDFTKSAARSADTAVKNKSDVELSLALSYLSNDANPVQNAKAVQLLWLATEKGNVEAELQLADLYTRGIAVQKNCVQARILLKAAAAANSALARQKLAELDESGCT